MQEYLSQAQHNQDFHDCVHSSFSDKFFDWKITALFYIAIHYLKALASQKGINIGDTHADIEKSVNPDKHDVKMRISRNAWRDYKSLYQYSRTARYEGIMDIKSFEKLKEIDHGYCLEHLRKFKGYIQGQGVII